MDTAQIISALSNVGLSATAQRIAVFQVVHNEADHPTPEQVKAAVDKVFPKISLATVYNTLNALVERGLVNAVKVPDSGKVVYDANVSKHYHFIDEDSGRLIDLSPELVQVNMNLPEAFQVNDVDVFIKGRRNT